MFAGSGTGGIPGSGTDRSATGPATGQVTAAGDAERADESRTVLGCGAAAGAGAGGCEAGRTATAKTTTTATMATSTQPSQVMRVTCRSVGRLTLPIPILPAYEG